MYNEKKNLGQREQKPGQREQKPGQRAIVSNIHGY